MLAITDKKGWISLPIIIFLLLVLGLASAYRTHLLEAFKWHSVLNDNQKSGLEWSNFERALAFPFPDFSSAKASSCKGFCSLTADVMMKGETRWRGSESVISYSFAFYQNAQQTLFHRLCATRNHQQYYCWWWQSKKLTSQGWVSTLH